MNFIRNEINDLLIILNDSADIRFCSGVDFPESEGLTGCMQIEGQKDDYRQKIAKIQKPLKRINHHMDYRLEPAGIMLVGTWVFRL